MVGRAREEFEKWALATGFGKKALERSHAGNYCHPHVYYAWLGFQHMASLGQYCQICGRLIEEAPVGKTDNP